MTPHELMVNRPSLTFDSSDMVTTCRGSQTHPRPMRANASVNRWLPAELVDVLLNNQLG